MIFIYINIVVLVIGAGFVLGLLYHWARTKKTNLNPGPMLKKENIMLTITLILCIITFMHILFNNL